MAAKTWEKDFRYEAIKASIRQLEDCDRDDLFRHSGSFCVPVAKKPVVGWTPGKIMLIFLVLGFILLGLGAWLATRVEVEGDDPFPALLAVAGVCTLSGFACFFTPVLFDRYIMRFLLGDRGGDLLARGGRMLCAEISDADEKKMKISIDGDDYVLIAADETDQRLIIEGVAARYQIRSEDVVSVTDFAFMNYKGAAITCRIDDDTNLTFAIARVSFLLELTRQVPIFFFLRKRIRNPILDVCTQTLMPVEVV